ncbi:type I-E CRISPR-associated endonuclease Cas1e [Sulfidibacter corallicola]|uniref:CRISPR-associated endonuclease Cas1 n=1 Tax=Sulfidibacter corallicola TaxID=2818388 RepID=A0A8A4TKA0_SULCO|nr:type I-E CRISPR-associated endonuclease Cas1e [Sulfidibacter corallicola]QTD49301.1 type I-E CRISPR-associated endonuclease Cas1 [Sulfidibacter corallicola]
MTILPKLRPTPIKDRISWLFLERGQLDVRDGAFVLVDQRGVRTHIPVGSVTCLFLEPGCRVTHEAVKLCAKVGCLLVWVGEAGVRLYAAGQPGGARADRLLYQAKLALDETLRLKVVRKMYALRFGEEPPARRSVNQLRGLEGKRVREIYRDMAARYGIPWGKRNYDPKDWDGSDRINQCLSSATACLYGLSEAAILAAGYAPSIGFVHVGKPRSFVFDIADLVKFESVVPVAFAVAAKKSKDPVREVRLKCRDHFRKAKLLGRLIPLIDEVLAAGGLDVATIEQAGVVGPAFSDEKGLGDAGHRG